MLPHAAFCDNWPLTQVCIPWTASLHRCLWGTRGSLIQEEAWPPYWFFASLHFPPLGWCSLFNDCLLYVFLLFLLFCSHRLAWGSLTSYINYYCKSLVNISLHSWQSSFQHTTTDIKLLRNLLWLPMAESSPNFLAWRSRFSKRWLSLASYLGPNPLGTLWYFHHVALCLSAWNALFILIPIPASISTGQSST